VDAELVRGSGGIFEVTANNRKLWSKKETGRFPAESEIIDRLRKI
jgi:selT/selW/selH-like putative selenoprotein